MVHHRRSMAWLMILFLMTLSLTACGPDEKREPARGAALPASSRDAILNERLSALQNRIAQLDHQISQAAVTSRQLNEELTALRQELAAGTAQRPAEAPVTPAAPPAVGTPVSAPGVVAPQQTVAPVIQQAPAVPLAPIAPTPPAPASHNPMFWILILAILAVAVYFIVKLLMGPWSEEEDSDWIEEGGPSDDEDKISLSPETSEKSDNQESGDEPKP